jgi:hypothetical protein
MNGACQLYTVAAAGVAAVERLGREGGVAVSGPCRSLAWRQAPRRVLNPVIRK